MKTFKEMLTEGNSNPEVFKLETEIENFFSKTRGVDVRSEDVKHWHNPKLLSVIAARHWGKWSVPDGEDDDIDYDWEVLDKSSASMLNSFLKQLGTKYPKYSLKFGVEEKNWINVLIEKK